MKKKIFALAFVAAMTLGLAKTAGSNGWMCDTFTLYCGDSPSHTILACGETTYEIQLQIFEWQSILCDSDSDEPIEP
jgi:hypothetical protein